MSLVLLVCAICHILFHIWFPIFWKDSCCGTICSICFKVEVLNLVINVVIEVGAIIMVFTLHMLSVIE